MQQIKTAILGAATGYQPQLVEPFVSSLMRIGYDGDLVLFINADQLADYQLYYQPHLQKLNIHFVQSVIGQFKTKKKKGKLYRSVIKKVAAIIPVDFFLPLKAKLLHVTGYPHVGRFFEYQKCLLNHPEYTQVLLSDVRDVIFQSNPFNDIEDTVYAGMENRKVHLSDDHYNKGWILDAYGSAVYEQLKSRQISCSGVTIGSAGAIKKYIEQMITEFLRQPYNKMSDRIYDQAMHNKLIHFNEIEQVTLCHPLESKIATLGLMDVSDFRFNEQGQLLNIDDSIVPIVHQYDRHPALMGKFVNS
jgi:hypothetical protein